MTDDKNDSLVPIGGPLDEPLVPIGRRDPERPVGISAPVDARGINHLAMNCVVPGLGSLARGKTRLGAMQLGMMIVALPVLIFSWKLAGLLVFGAYLWSIISGIGFLRQGSSGLDWR